MDPFIGPQSIESQDIVKKLASNSVTLGTWRALHTFTYVFLAPVSFIKNVIFAMELGQGHMEESRVPPTTQNDWKYLARRHVLPCTSCFSSVLFDQSPRMYSST